MGRWNIQEDHALVCATLLESGGDWLESVSADVYWDRADVDAATDAAVTAAMSAAWTRAENFGLSLAFEYLRQNGLGDTLPGVVMPDVRDFDMIEPCEREDYAVAEDAAHDAIIAAAVHVAALLCQGAAIVAGRAILEGR